MSPRRAVPVPLIVLVGMLCCTEVMARTWIIPHVIAKTNNSFDNYNFGLRFALADALAPGGTADATTVDFYWYNDAGVPVKALGGADVCNPCQRVLDDSQPYGVADLRALMNGAGGFMGASHFGFIVVVAPDQVAPQAFGTYRRADSEMGVDLERTWEIGLLEPGSATEAFLLPHFLETQGAALGTGAAFFENVAYDQQIFGVYTGGLPGQPSPGAGATVDVYLFDEDTNAPLMGMTGAVCNPCSYNLGVGTPKFSLNLHTAVNLAGGFVNSTERGYALALVSGESERVLLQAYRFGRRIFDDFHEDGVPMVSVPIPVSLSGTVGVESEGGAMARLVAAPNPFGSRATLRFVVKKAGTVRATIHDVSGRRLRVLHDGERVAGPQQLLWDGRDEQGRELGPGSYFARIETPEGSMATKLVRIQ